MGCPAYAYILDPRLQYIKKIPKWDPKTHQDQYRGWSLNHASSVGLICNLRTGYISPQFHVVYDNSFQTIMGEYKDNKVVVNQIWDSLAHAIAENVLEQAS